MTASMGRPKILDDAKRKMVSVPAALAQAIEDYRFTHRLKTEAEAIRQLIEAGLGAIGTRGGPRSGGSTPGSARKPASADKSTAPRAKKPTASDRQASPAQTKESQIRALREQGAG
jgi:hypothetical protein